MGREIWKKRAARGKVQISEQELTRVAHRLRFDDSQTLFYEIGSGNYDVNDLFKAVQQLKSKGRFEEEVPESGKGLEPDQQEKFLSAARSVGGSSELLVNGEISNIKYSYANCCNPIPGDQVIGFISRDGDVKIHRSSCKNAHHLIQTDSERIITVNWARNTDARFLGGIRVLGEDRVGLVNDLTDILSRSMKTNMKSINVNSDSGMFEGIISLYVTDLAHLEKIMDRLKKVEGVKSVMRYD